MTATPDITQDIFDASKRYLGRFYQQNKELFDWDINESESEFIWWMLTILANTSDLTNNSFRVKTDALNSIQIVPDSAVNDAGIDGGFACVKGRPLFIDSTRLDSNANILVSGFVSSIDENTPTSDYDIIDDEKVFTDDYGLDGNTRGKARIKFISGALSGSEFDIDSRVSATELNILGDLSTASPGDEYIIKPPLLTTPAGGPQTDNIYLITFWEDISGVEDPDLVDVALDAGGIEPSHRRQLRWCVYPNYDLVPSTIESTDILTGFNTLKICEITRPDTQDTVELGDETDEDNYVYDLVSVDQHIDDIEADIVAIEADVSTAQSDILDNESEIDENQVVLAKVDFIPSRFEGPNPSLVPAQKGYDTGAYSFRTGLMGANSLGSRFVAADAGVSGTFSSGAAADGNKVFCLRVADPADDSTTTAEITDVGTALTSVIDVLDNELVIAAAYANSGGTIKRGMSFGNIPFKRGLNYSARFNSSFLEIYPGELMLGGSLCQHPRVLQLLETTTANWIEGVAPTDSWYYIYAYTKTGKRNLNFFLSVTNPMWSGEFPNTATVVAYNASASGFTHCIGMGRVDASSESFPMHCMNGKILFDIAEATEDYRSLNAYVPMSATITTAGTTTLTTIPPKGVSSFKMMILAKTFRETIAATNSPVFYVKWKRNAGASTTFTKVVAMGASEVTSAEYDSIEFDMPGRVGDQIDVITDNTATLTLSYVPCISVLEFDHFYFPDDVSWLSE